MILHEEGILITADKITALVKAANVHLDSYWPSLFAKLTDENNVKDLISNTGARGGSAADVALSTPASGGAAVVEAPAAEEEKEDKDESDEDIGGLFDMLDKSAHHLFCIVNTVSRMLADPLMQCNHMIYRPLCMSGYSLL
ncbi:hypothetical protein MKW94_005237 [Papaver nudicaule]|uniref:60S acidic ribosomal protein P1 n=1 Tax=Papaver nudicaule TaxID=74823 RepID=A0AA42AVF2_PAPNU|nr:hypothetical protein [Papaver nudicaule]